MMMLVYCRGNELPVEVEDLGCGVGRIKCLECGGGGDALLLPEEGGFQCVDCKGTGTMLVGL